MVLPNVPLPLSPYSVAAVCTTFVELATVQSNIAIDVCMRAYAVASYQHMVLHWEWSIGVANIIVRFVEFVASA